MPFAKLQAAALLLVSFAAACGGAQPEASSPVPGSTTSPMATSATSATPATTTAPTGAAPAPAGSAAPAGTAAAGTELPTAWKSGMTKDQQIAFMKQRVLPPLSKTFKDHDAKRYAEVGCKTCHGPQFKEPKDFLPHLTLKDGKLTAFAEKPEISKFMAEKVTPDMAAAMGLAPYDPKTHQGFGCGGCHTIDPK